MPRFTRVLLCVLLILASMTASACSKSPQENLQLSDDELDERARTFVRYMAEIMPEDAAKMMDSKMAAAMPAKTLIETWQGLETQMGLFDSITGARVTVEAGYKCVYVTCKFEKMLVDTKVVFDSVGKVSGLWFAPSQTAGASYAAPAYASEDAFSESEVTIGEGQWALPGTLTLPKGEGPFPAVVLVHGSGPNDRDETIGPNKPFKDLAWGLASNGIAVLRYEKRTKQYAEETAQLIASLTVKEEVVDDALQALALLRQTQVVDPGKVFVLGHSLGASLGPRIVDEATRGEMGSGSVAGLIMLAPNARDLLDLMVEQFEYIAMVDGTVSDSEAANISAVKADVAKIKEGRTQDGEVTLGASKAYWDDLRAYDPVETAHDLGIPLLVLQGARDYQVTMADFLLWIEGLSDGDGFTLQSFPGLNHLFIFGEEKSAPAEYQEQGNVDVTVIDRIVQWIESVQ